MVGPHASGKSTIGKLLNTKGMCFKHEISEIFHGPAPIEEIESGIFQRKIMDAEFERDNKELYNNISRKDAIIIESYHIGNLAHTKLLFPEMLNEYLERFKKQLKNIKEFYVIFLKIDPSEVIPARKKYLNLPEMQRRILFNKKLEKELLKIIKDFKIKTFYVNGNSSIEKVLSEVEKVVHQIESD